VTPDNFKPSPTSSLVRPEALRDLGWMSSCAT
jgi:hypothetical protein